MLVAKAHAGDAQGDTKKEDTMIWPTKGYKSRKELCLLISHQCNLDCTYCYVDKSPRENDLMSLETAKQAIIDLFSDSFFEEVEISFLGGEPLLYFERIAEIAQWVLDQTWNKPYILFATVNGTLLNDEIKAWFRERRDRFYLCLSYDGKTKAQDINRCGSDNQIDLDFFINTWPDQPVKMSVSEESVPYLAANVIDLHERKVEIDISLALGTPRWRDDSVRLFRKQLDILADYYVSRQELMPIAFLRHDLRGIWIKEDDHRRYCGAGKQFSAVYIDGNKYPCHLLSPLVLSDERMKDAEELDVWNTTVDNLPVCRNCMIRRFCPMCIGMNFKQTGNPAIRDINSCMLVKQQILASCRFQALLMGHSQKHDKTDEEIAKAVLTLARALKPTKP